MTPEVIKIAYADDHALVRNGISTVLNVFEDIDVIIQAKNGRDLIKQLEQATVLPDICLLDINMPEMDGFDTISSIKEKWPEIKVLILTVFDSDLYITRMIRYGASGYLLKSSDPEELRAALKTTYMAGYYYADANTNKLLDEIKRQEKEMPPITDDEILFLQNACTEKSYVTIAETLNTTVEVINGYKESLYRKFEMNNRTNLALLAMQLGIVNIERN